MLKLTNIKKDYYIAGKPFSALKGIDLSFEKKSFVAILGPSGCGKTTLLNIIGGLDQYTSGDLVIEGKSTKDFKDNDWDYYRNNKVGFIFQNYHLINHISIIENVEMGMTLSGISAKERREKAIEVLTRVGLEDQIYKKSGQLSGGQKQRAAIARALANDPEIILADEPTGALDTKTSIQILELIKEIAEEKLVIMVTHNEKLADQYANRIINLLDGEVISDTKVAHEVEKTSNYVPRKTSMTYIQALRLSFRNLRTKFGRTLTTALAGSIGIIGVLLVLGLGNGFNGVIHDIERESLASVPLMISQTQFDISNYMKEPNDTGGFQTYDPQNRFNGHKNIITQEYLEYLEENLDPTTYSTIEPIYSSNNIFLNQNQNGDIKQMNTSLFEQLDPSFLEEYYTVVSGRVFSKDKAEDGAFEMVILMDQYYQVKQEVLQALNYNIENDFVRYEEVVGTEIILPYYNDYYYLDESNASKPVYRVNSNLNTAYNEGIKIRIVGVMMPKEGTMFSMGDGFYYSQEVTKQFIKNAEESDIVALQLESNYLVYDYSMIALAGTEFNQGLTKEMALARLGNSKIPVSLNIYPTSYENKVKIKAVLDEYNKQFDTNSPERILYTDLAETVGGALGQVVSMIQIVLVVFASISLVVSSIMIGIITHVSVLERTQEIGILRALGARRRDIKRVFNSETFLIGLSSGILGSLISFLLSIPLNFFIVKLEPSMKNVISITFIHVGVMVLVSVLLTFIAGLIPASMASRKHPVDALRHNE